MLPTSRPATRPPRLSRGLAEQDLCRVRLKPPRATTGASDEQHAAYAVAAREYGFRDTGQNVQRPEVLKENGSRWFYRPPPPPCATSNSAREAPVAWSILSYTQ